MIGARHAVWLMAGWLLMLPPMIDDRYNPNAPIEQWEQASAHDSAKQCETAKERLSASIEQTREKIKRDPSASVEQRASELKALIPVVFQFSAAKCVLAKRIQERCCSQREEEQRSKPVSKPSQGATPERRR